jgi:hypothetical protein
MFYLMRASSTVAVQRLIMLSFHKVIAKLNLKAWELVSKKQVVGIINLVIRKASSPKELGFRWKKRKLLQSKVKAKMATKEKAQVSNS